MGGRRGRGLRSSCCSSNSADIFSAPHPLLHHFPQHCCGHRRKFAPMPKQETINWEIQSRLDNSQKLWNIEGLFQNTKYLTSICCCCPRCYLLPSSSPLNHSPLVPTFLYHWKSFHSSLSLRAQIHILGWNRGKRKIKYMKIFFAKKWLGGLQLGFRSLSRQGTHGMGSLSGYWSPAKTSWANTLQPSKFWHTTSGLVKP